MIYGIDVSKHNTITDWKAVKASGKKFVFITEKRMFFLPIKI